MTYSHDPLMSGTPHDWQQHVVGVRDQMAEIVRRVVTPLSVADGFGDGVARGTGNYFAVNGRPYLLTAEHVVLAARDSIIAHLPDANKEYVALTNHIQREAWPVDVAWTRLSDWPENPIDREALDLNVLDESANAVADELFFWIGYPGTTLSRHDSLTDTRRRRVWFDSLETPGVPVVTQRPRHLSFVDDDFDPAIHLAVHYPGTAIEVAGGKEEELPHASGMSGSLLWNTKYVESIGKGVEWSPFLARVCGILRGVVTNPNLVIATRIEAVRPVLLEFLRREAAYFSWLDRGMPEGDALHDWIRAEHRFPPL